MWSLYFILTEITSGNEIYLTNIYLLKVNKRDTGGWKRAERVVKRVENVFKINNKSTRTLSFLFLLLTLNMFH